MLTPILTTFALLVASLSAAVILTSEDAVWIDGASVMLASGHLLLTAVVIIGSLVGAARWSVGLGAGLAGVIAVPAVVHPIGPVWIVMVGTAGLALAGLLGTGLRAVVRQRPPTDSPPKKAVALTLGLLAGPVLIGALQPDGVDLLDWILAGGTVALAVWYSRAKPAALWATRLGLPVAVVATVLAVPFPGSVAAAIGFVALTWLAWSTDARIAVIPLASPGRAVPIPAELAPGEILDAAGLDSRGRRKDDP
ncbi:MAG: hypothetical protein WD204_00840 [Acidimicrobiia bacterium]